MGRLIAVLLGGAGMFAFWRRRRKPAEPEVSPADELRTKLAESRAAGAEEPEPELESDLEQRRREVHERAKGAIDELS
jgi:hypothetical protein